MKTSLAALGLLFVAACATDPVEEGHGLAKKPPRPSSEPDAAPPPSYPDPSIPGVVACFTEGAPAQTCAPGSGCLFNNYNAFHDGYCTSTAPTAYYGWETCDGPEDCAAGSSCCVVGGRDTSDALYWTIACSATPCATGSGNYEMCHPGGSCSDPTRSCVSAKDAGDYSIAANLYVCN
jgi:hypothetical protein